MGVLGKDLLDFYRPRTNTKVEFGASGYWVESNPTMQPYGAVLTEILNLDAAPFQELLDQYRKTVALSDMTATLILRRNIYISIRKMRKASLDGK